MLGKILKSTIFLLALMPIASYSQNQDSLLKQINDIDISLSSPVDAEENLFMNTVSFQSFYDVLSPMGEWIQITKEDVDEDLNEGEGQAYSSLTDDDDLLFIWKPAVTPSWKPYMNGRWEYTDHGWLWISADSWGNSTYNYGRWWNSAKYGWVWLPGYTWAPGWVRWKVSENSIGWAPLSPKAKWKSETGITEKNYKYKNNDNDWVFVNDINFANEINNTNVINPSQNSQLVKSSNNITDIRVENDKVINAGPDVSYIEKRTGRKFPRKKINFSRDRNKPVIGNEDIILGREKFSKYSLDADTKKPRITDKPGKYKKSERVKKILKKRHKLKNHPKRRLPKR